MSMILGGHELPKFGEERIRYLLECKNNLEEMMEKVERYRNELNFVSM
jgi:hypothetical protein